MFEAVDGAEGGLDLAFGLGREGDGLAAALFGEAQFALERLAASAFEVVEVIEDLAPGGLFHPLGELDLEDGIAPFHEVDFDEVVDEKLAVGFVAVGVFLEEAAQGDAVAALFKADIVGVKPELAGGR